MLPSSVCDHSPKALLSWWSPQKPPLSRAVPRVAATAGWITGLPSIARRLLDGSCVFSASRQTRKSPSLADVHVDTLQLWHSKCVLPVRCEKMLASNMMFKAIAHFWVGTYLDQSCGQRDRVSVHATPQLRSLALERSPFCISNFACEMLLMECGLPGTSRWWSRRIFLR